MNDFTKEELQLIYRMFHHFVYSPYWKKSDEQELLKDKIASMIDNCDAKVIEVWHCEKCGHIQ